MTSPTQPLLYSVALNLRFTHLEHVREYKALCNQQITFVALAALSVVITAAVRSIPIVIGEIALTAFITVVTVAAWRIFHAWRPVRDGNLLAPLVGQIFAQDYAGAIKCLKELPDRANLVDRYRILAFEPYRDTLELEQLDSKL